MHRRLAHRCGVISAVSLDRKCGILGDSSRGRWKARRECSVLHARDKPHLCPAPLCYRYALYLTRLVIELTEKTTTPGSPLRVKKPFEGHKKHPSTTPF